MSHNKQNIPLSLLALVFASLLAVLFARQAFAAVDGILAPKTTGQTDVRLRILDTMHFSVEVDFEQEKLSPNGDIIREIDTCISFNGSSSYSIIVTTNTEGFLLKKTAPASTEDNAAGTTVINVSGNAGVNSSDNAGANSSDNAGVNSSANASANSSDNSGVNINGNGGVEFFAYWNQSSRRKDRKPLQYGIPFFGGIIDQDESEKCSAGKGRGNSRFSIQIPKTSRAKIKTGRYRATISLIISPY